MDKEIFQFIIGGIVIIPVLFLVIRFIMKRGQGYQGPKNDLYDPTDPTSLWNFHRRNPPPG